MNDSSPSPRVVRVALLARHLLDRPDTRATVVGGARPLVACDGTWTGGLARWFRADTLLLALEAALVARAAAVGDPVTRDGRPVVPGLDVWYAHPITGRTQAVLVGADVRCAWWSLAPVADGRPQAVRMGYADCWSIRSAAARSGGRPAPRPRGGSWR